MSYALISEAYKISDEKVKEVNFKQRPEINRIVEPFDNVNKFPSSNTSLNSSKEDGLAYQYYQDFDAEEEYDSDDELECNDVLQHIRGCKICQSKLIIDKDPLSIPDNIIDMILYTITGIFILFLLDIVLRLGKSLT